MKLYSKVKSRVLSHIKRPMMGDPLQDLVQTNASRYIDHHSGFWPVRMVWRRVVSEIFRERERG